MSGQKKGTIAAATKVPIRSAKSGKKQKEPMPPELVARAAEDQTARRSVQLDFLVRSAPEHRPSAETLEAPSDPSPESAGQVPVIPSKAGPAGRVERLLISNLPWSSAAMSHQKSSYLFTPTMPKLEPLPAATQRPVEPPPASEPDDYDRFDGSDPSDEYEAPDEYNPADEYNLVDDHGPEDVPPALVPVDFEPGTGTENYSAARDSDVAEVVRDGGAR